MNRRRLLVVLGFYALCAWTSLASGGSYLSRAAVLLDGAEMEGTALRRRLHDKDLARLTHRLALARVEGAREMPVPKEVVRAHPHLLLVLEAYERAADAAVRGADESFLVALARAREERRTFEAVLSQLGWTLKQSISAR